MIKENIRSEMREKRRALTMENVTDLSCKIKEKLFSLDCIQNAKAICCFLSSFKEPDTTEVIKLLLQNNCRIIVPISDTVTNTLSLSYIDSLDSLQKGAYGIREPSVRKIADISDIDVILVPGLAFDISGARMGFGKGYYDRLLEKSSAVKIGLCYDFQLLDKIPTAPHDIPMDYIITEKEILEIR